MTKYFNDIQNTLTNKEIEAIKKAHDRMFFVRMNGTLDDERQVINQLRETMPNVIHFIPDFFNGNDALIFTD